MKNEINIQYSDTLNHGYYKNDIKSINISYTEIQMHLYLEMTRGVVSIALGVLCMLE